MAANGIGRRSDAVYTQRNCCFPVLRAEKQSEMPVRRAEGEFRREGEKRRLYRSRYSARENWGAKKDRDREEREREREEKTTTRITQSARMWRRWCYQWRYRSIGFFHLIKFNQLTRAPRLSYFAVRDKGRKTTGREIRLICTHLLSWIGNWLGFIEWRAGD